MEAKVYNELPIESQNEMHKIFDKFLDEYLY